MHVYKTAQSTFMTFEINLTVQLPKDYRFDAYVSHTSRNDDDRNTSRGWYRLHNT